MDQISTYNNFNKTNINIAYDYLVKNADIYMYKYT